MVMTLQLLMLEAIFFKRYRILKFLYALNTLYQSNCSIYQVKLRKHVFVLILLYLIFYDMSHCIQVL